MSKIKALDFAKYVDDNRKRLIAHCRENGKDVSEKDNLYDIVTRNNEINIEDKCKVEFIDLDGSTLALTQYVEVGGKATLPDIIPSFDSEYLEFVQWRTSASDSLDNVTRDILVMPEYQVKYDEATGQRPTYLICYFDDNTLSPTFYFGSYSTTNYKNAYIDYGDGTVEQITKSSMPHTYANKGLYTIKIYGDKYMIGGSHSYGLFSSSVYQTVLLKAYLGDNVDINNVYAFKYSQSLTSVVMPNTVTSIGSAIFAECTSLNNIVIPNTVTEIIGSTFENCHSLANVIIPDTVIRIGSNTFKGCYSLTNITIPNSVISIGNYAFSNCRSLCNIIIPDTVSIGYGVFESCFLLASITIPNNITKIGSSTFGSCYSLNNVVIPSSVREINNNTFSTCYSLTNITLLSSPTSIDNSAFSICYALTNVTFPNNFNATLDLHYSPLSTECLVNMANVLKDNTGETAKILTLSKDKVYSRANSLIYLNANGEQVSKDSEGAMTLVEYIQNKNWTVTFA